MIHISMDTSGIGTNKSLSHASYKALKRLVDADQIKVHIPYVVKREFETQEYERYIKEYQSALSGVKGLNRIQKSPSLQAITSDLVEKIQSLEDEIKDDANKHSKLWFEGLNTEFYEIDGLQAKNSLEAYFSGKAPLTQSKNRNDIPDSFICRGIEKIKENLEHIHLIVKDNKIVKTFNDNSNFTLYQSITSFIESKDMQVNLKKLDILDDYINNFLQFLQKLESKNPTIEYYLSSKIGDEIYGMTIKDDSIPDDNHEATIRMYGDGSNVNLDFANPIYYGNDQIGIKFDLEVEVYADYYIYKADYYSMLDGDVNLSVSDWNDHYFEVEREFNIKVTGIVSVKFDVDSLDLKEIAGIEIDQLEDFFSDVYSGAEVNIESVDNIELC